MAGKGLCDGMFATLYLWFAYVGSHLIVLKLQVLFELTLGWCLSERIRIKVNGELQQLTILPLLVFNPFWSVKLTKESRSKKVPSGSIVMCNHLSYVDSWVLAWGAYPQRPKFAARSGLFSPWGISGNVIRLAGHMPIQFYQDEEGHWHATKESVENSMERSKLYLQWKECIAVYPEGKLSWDGTLQPFKDGFFKLAIETGAPIVPFQFVGNQDAFPPTKDQFALAHSATIYLAIGDPIDPKAYSNFEELKEAVRESMLHLRSTLPDPKSGKVMSISTSDE